MQIREEMQSLSMDAGVGSWGFSWKTTPAHLPLSKSADKGSTRLDLCQSS